MPAPGWLNATPSSARSSRASPDLVHPVIHRIVEPAANLSAANAFRGFYRLEALRRQVAPLIDAVDLLCVPSIPTFYTLDDLEADPIGPTPGSAPTQISSTCLASAA